MAEQGMIKTNPTSNPSSPPPPAPPDIVQHQAARKKYNTTRATFAPVRVHFAVNSADLTRMTSLIEQGIDLNYVTLDGNTPLTLAILKDQFDIAQMLVYGGADVTRPEQGPWRRQPIHLAARAGCLGLVENLVAHDASVHAADATSFTPLHWAAHSGHMEVVEYLMDSGVHLNVRDDRGRTPLFRAAESGHVLIVKYLYENGAGVNIRDSYGWTPIYQSLACADVVMVTTLLDFYADLRLIDNKGDTPVHVAVSRLDRSNMRILSCTDVSIFMRDLNVATRAVQDAIQAVGVDGTLLQHLLDYGARPNALNVTGKSPFRLATETGNVEAMRLLVSAGTDLQKEKWLQDRSWPSSIVDNEEICAWLEELISVDVPPLVQLSRLAVRSSLRRKIAGKITELPLPPKLKEFLELPN